jgi:hypothetical protein
MQSPKTEPKPYLTATLTSPHTILDFSGKQPFTFLITLTLHASAPILAYTEVYDTFFLPRSALTDVGIIFTDHKTKEEVRICHIDSAAPPGYARALTEERKLVLRPEEAVVFEVPIDILSGKDTDTEMGFDPWMASLSSVFEDGGVYEAELPLYRTLDWWRYAKPSELEDNNHTNTAALVSVGRDEVDGEGDVEARYGVPVLAYDQQLPIYIEGDGVVFSCVGKAMQWPAELLEKQKMNKQRRDGKEKKKAEEKRRARENAK